jgi:hypothetical protein
VISPYRVVADNSREIFRKVFPRAGDDDLDQWISTVHKMQGREADAVILVLGGDPDKPGSRRFARETPISLTSPSPAPSAACTLSATTRPGAANATSPRLRTPPSSPTTVRVPVLRRPEFLS